MTLRLPTDLEIDVRQVALSKGDLSRIVLFAMEHMDQQDVELIKTRKADLGLGRPMLLHVGAQARAFLRAWAEREDASVNQVVVSLLEKFFALRKRKAALRQELPRRALDLEVGRGHEAAVGLLLDVEVGGAEQPQSDLVGAIGDLAEEGQPVARTHAARLDRRGQQRRSNPLDSSVSSAAALGPPARG